MNADISQKRAHFNIFLAAFLLLVVSDSFSLSSMGTATIIDSNGTPCFSIQEDSETKHGLPLFSLIIREARKANSDEPSPLVWSFRANDPEKPPTIFPRKCIRFGENPANTSQHTLIPLELFKAYHASISADNDVSNIVAYVRMFCIKPAGSGKILLHVISGDKSLGESRFAECSN